MAKRQDKLASILAEYGKDICLPPQKKIFYESKYNDLIHKTYKKLGGILDEYPVNFGNFDIELDTCYIELDEEQHFTRYRKTTLESDFYKKYNCFPVECYSRLCENKEDNARTYGNFWTNKSCEKQFGKSSDNGNFLGNGSARWKQRAFYDFLKDIYGLINNKPVYRFSIYEVVANNHTVNAMLTNDRLNEELFNFVSKRIR